MNNLAFSLGDRHEDIAFIKQMYKPGPGTHNPEKVGINRRVRIGTSKRPQLGADNETMGKPGPNNYN